MAALQAIQQQRPQKTPAELAFEEAQRKRVSCQSSKVLIAHHVSFDALLSTFLLATSCCITIRHSRYIRLPSSQCL